MPPCYAVSPFADRCATPCFPCDYVDATICAGGATAPPPRRCHRHALFFAAAPAIFLRRYATPPIHACSLRYFRAATPPAPPLARRQFCRRARCARHACGVLPARFAEDYAIFRSCWRSARADLRDGFLRRCSPPRDAAAARALVYAGQMRRRRHYVDYARCKFATA